MCSLNRMPGAGLGHDGCERSLADLEQIAPQVVAIEFDEVESIEEDALVSAVVTNEIERSPLSSQATASPSMMQDVFMTH
jgi:hypothetical protein